YTHDDLVRIASANCGSIWSQTFSYDAFGNINKSGSSSFGATYSSATNRMTQMGSSTPTYDANGNVTNDFLNTYAWNADGRPATITIDSSGTTVGLTYDALGRTVEVVFNGTAPYIQHVYAPSGDLLFFMKGQTFDEEVVSLPAGEVAIYTSSGLARYRHPDWLGSVRLMTSTSQTVTSDLSYGPFGEQYAVTGTGDAPSL